MSDWTIDEELEERLQAPDSDSVNEALRRGRVEGEMRLSVLAQVLNDIGGFQYPRRVAAGLLAAHMDRRGFLDNKAQADYLWKQVTTGLGGHELRKVATELASLRSTAQSAAAHAERLAKRHERGADG